MQTRALLIFADSLALDLARRRLPRSLAALFPLPIPADQSPVEADIHLFSSAPAASPKESTAHYFLHRQCGRTFGEKLEAAAATLASLGYAEIVIVGRDCPGMSQHDIRAAFARLRSARLVLGPDHRGGCYLIALRSSDRHLLAGIRWKQNTDCAQLSKRAGSGQVELLEVRPDIDSWADLRLLGSGDDAVAALAALLLQWLCSAGEAACRFVDLARHFMRIRWQMPPPARAI